MDDGARVFAIHRPADWARLVTEHPRDASREPHGSCWELPTAEHAQRTDGSPGWAAAYDVGPADVSALLMLPGQRAARTTIRRHLVPDWGSVAEHYAGVHLSWAGFITSEGCITDLGDGDVAMLRYWFSERTHWLADVFGTPQRARPPVRSDPGGGTPSPPSDAQQRDLERTLDRLLGR